MSGETRAKPIRGPQRIALVLDLASGELTHEALGKKYGRSTQTIHEFSAYNSGEIQQARDTLAEAVTDELCGVLIANKVNRIKWLDQYHRDCEEELETATDSRERRQLRAQAAKLLHQAAEMLGELPTRSTIELESAPTLRHIVEGWSPDKWAADLRAGIPAPVDDLDPAPVVTEPNTDGDNVDRLFRAQPSPARNDGPSIGTAQPAERPSKLEKIATNLVAKVRADGMLRLDQLAPGLAQERVDEVLAFVLSRQWLALRGARVVLGAKAPVPPAPPARSAAEQRMAWGPGG